jgi:hypothetical protein
MPVTSGWICKPAGKQDQAPAAVSLVAQGGRKPALEHGTAASNPPFKANHLQLLAW